MSAASPRNISTSFANGKINGTKLPVPDGDVADVAIVVVNSGGTGEQGISLAVVDLKGAGVTREVLRTIDPTRSHATITFKDTPAELMGPAGKGWAQLSRVFDGAAVLFAFEQVGGSEAAIEMARDYSLERYAFGRQIGSYQAIKHKLADMYVKKELAKSNAYFGAMMLNFIFEAVGSGFANALGPLGGASLRKQAAGLFEVRRFKSDRRLQPSLVASCESPSFSW